MSFVTNSFRGGLQKYERVLTFSSSNWKAPPEIINSEVNFMLFLCQFENGWTVLEPGGTAEDAVEGHYEQIDRYCSPGVDLPAQTATIIKCIELSDALLSFSVKEGWINSAEDDDLFDLESDELEGWYRQILSSGPTVTVYAIRALVAKEGNYVQEIKF